MLSSPAKKAGREMEASLCISPIFFASLLTFSTIIEIASENAVLLRKGSSLAHNLSLKKSKIFCCSEQRVSHFNKVNFIVDNHVKTAHNWYETHLLSLQKIW